MSQQEEEDVPITTQFFPSLDEFADVEQGSVRVEDGDMSLGVRQQLGRLQSRLDRLDITRKAKPVQGKIPASMIIKLANEVFGFEGWCTEVVDIVLEEENVNVNENENGDGGGNDNGDGDRNGTSYTVRIISVVRVTLKDGTSCQEMGTGLSNNLPKPMAYSTAKKAAITDGIKNSILALPKLTIGE